ncbi:MAG: TolAQR complex membrane spanning protein [Wigglesworthia glossinidia]|nr:TolAQR complex membrane spanning protein [Wigglesworthia glossinidia]
MIQINVFDLFLKSDFLLKTIFSFLFLASIISWIIIFYKIFIFRYIKKKIKKFEKQFFSNQDIAYIYKKQVSEKNDLIGYAQIFYSGLKEFYELKVLKGSPQSIIEGTKRIMNIVLNREIEILETHIATLGSISSISPYVGLLGTVWGIMNVFYKINEHVNFTIQTIAPDISDSLSTTAMSLFVAIPALVGFNKLSVKSNIISQRYLNFSEQLSLILYRKILSEKD